MNKEEAVQVRVQREFERMENKLRERERKIASLTSELQATQQREANAYGLIAVLIKVAGGTVTIPQNAAADIDEDRHRVDTEEDEQGRVVLKLVKEGLNG